MLCSTLGSPKSLMPGELTKGDCALPSPLSLTMLFGLAARGLGCELSPTAEPPTLPFLSAVALALAMVARPFSRLGESPACGGVVVVASTLDLRFEERGVIFPFPTASLTGVSSLFTCSRGRGLIAAGSGIVVGGRLIEPVPDVDGVAVAKRGVRGALGARVAASVGLSGRPWVLLRSDDMAGGITVPDSLALCNFALSRRSGCSGCGIVQSSSHSPTSVAPLAVNRGI